MRLSTAGSTRVALSGRPLGAAECGTRDGVDAPRLSAFCGVVGAMLAPGGGCPKGKAAGDCGSRAVGPRELPPGSTLVGAGTPPSAGAGGCTFPNAGGEGCGKLPSGGAEAGNCGACPGSAEKKAPASCVSMAMSGNPGGGAPPGRLLVGVWIVMELADLNIFQHGQRVVGLHDQ